MQERTETLARLQEIIDRSIATAGPAIRQNFTGPEWSMSAEELVKFWGAGRVASVSTVSAAGAVHVAPLEITLVDGKFHAPTFANSRRLKDHRENPRCGIAAWEGEAYWAVIAYGTAREADRHPAAAAAMVEVEITPTRIYAIRPPKGHPARQTPFSVSILDNS